MKRGSKPFNFSIFATGRVKVLILFSRYPTETPINDPFPDWLVSGETVNRPKMVGTGLFWWEITPCFRGNMYWTPRDALFDEVQETNYHSFE